MITITNCTATMNISGKKDASTQTELPTPTRTLINVKKVENAETRESLMVKKMDRLSLEKSLRAKKQNRCFLCNKFCKANSKYCKTCIAFTECLLPDEP